MRNQLKPKNLSGYFPNSLAQQIAVQSATADSRLREAVFAVLLLLAEGSWGKPAALLLGARAHTLPSSHGDLAEPCGDPQKKRFTPCPRHVGFAQA